MSEPICPTCEGSGWRRLQVKYGKARQCEVWVWETVKCPTCDASGIATDNEVEEFDDASRR